ncbi:MAG: RdgB/HAM1 family non-canonical purine NTP pyrophosphatase [Ginsengibacter sp.]
METLIFATNNTNKIKEIGSLLDDSFIIKTLQEVGITIEIHEPHDTLEENAIEKAKVIHDLTRENCFAEDTGLAVWALNGEPGVKSARYAGDKRSSEDNIDTLLSKLSDKNDRSASFKTIICLIFNQKQILFEGICKGTIIADRRGKNGFGYDSIFIPDGAGKTFAEMSLTEKNTFSHRKKAFEKLISYLTVQD